MKRISIFVREDQKKGLDKLSANSKTSYSELIREAIDTKLFTDFSKVYKTIAIDETFGLLKDRFNKDITSEEIVDGLRSEWEERFERHKK